MERLEKLRVEGYSTDSSYAFRGENPWSSENIPF